LNSNNGIVFAQDNGILANTKIGEKKKSLNNKNNMEKCEVCWYVVCGILVCDMWVCCMLVW
jgi:hypothetical protein